MLFLNNNYHYTIAMMGRRQTGKMSFLLMMMDRNDITMRDVFQNEDYYKVTYATQNSDVFSIYKYNGFENDLSSLEAILQQLSSFISKLDYVFYFVRSIQDIHEFDRRLIQRLNEKGVTVLCVFNKRSNEEISKAQLYIEQGNLNVHTLACNCLLRSDVMLVNEQLEQYVRDEVALHDLTRFLLEAPRTVLFLDPITVGAGVKNIDLKYFQLFKSIVNQNGTAIYMNKDRLKSFLRAGSIRPDVLITGNKILLEIDDMMNYI